MHPLFYSQSLNFCLFQNTTFKKWLSHLRLAAQAWKIAFHAELYVQKRTAFTINITFPIFLTYNGLFPFK